jgi:hypothetical protein
MRRAPIAFAVIACLAVAACGPNLPDRMWRSDNVRYFSRAGDDAVCPAILDELEQHGQLITDELMLETRTLISYYKFDGLDDFEKNADCSPDADACAPNATVRSPLDFDRHELIHAYLSPVGRPPWLLAEGAAVALSCETYPRPAGDWRNFFSAPHSSPALYGAGGWLVGYLLTMFPARLLPRLYSRVAINATADQFALVFKDVYGMDLDVVWPTVIGGPGQPMRCDWECGRPAFAIDGAAHALTPVCGAGSLQLSVDVPNAGLSRWRVDGAASVRVQSCDGSDSPLVPVTGTPGPGALLAPLTAGSYFIDAAVDVGGTPALAATVTQGDGLSWSVCASAPALPDDLSALSSLMLFYPSGTTPQFTSFATGTPRGGQLFIASFDLTATANLCAGCDTQCVGAGSQGLSTQSITPGAVLSVPAGPAITATFRWN